MKKYSLIIFFLLISYGLQSQVLIALLLGDKLNTGKIEFGLDGGLNYSGISGLETNNLSQSFFLGFYFDIKIKEHWYLNTGVLVKSTLGADNLTDADLSFLEVTIPNNGRGVYTQKMSSFLVPILAKYKFKNNLYVEAGPQVGWIYNSWIEYNFEEDRKNSIKIKQNNDDIVNWFDLGVTAGAGIRLLKGLGWTVGARYYYGLTNVYKGRSGTKNNSIFLKVNVPFGLSDVKKKEIKEMKDNIKAKKTEKKESRKKTKKNTKNKI
jgi:outer membrane protein with beta-barrel domain